MKAELLAFKKITIIPHDNITGNSLQYNMDTETGNFTYIYDVSGSILFVPISFKGQGSFKVDPALLVSKNLKPKDQFAFGPFSCIVESIEGGKATCSVKYLSSDVNESGTLMLDVSKDFIDVISISASGTVKGFNEQIEAKEV